jgi:hypothetical protein
MAFKLLRGMSWLGVVAAAYGAMLLAYGLFGTVSANLIRTGAFFVLLGIANVALARRYTARLRAHLAKSGV